MILLPLASLWACRGKYGTSLSSREAPVLPKLSRRLYMAVLLFSWLPPYRVLMVWVYDRTESLLVAMLMHGPIVSRPVCPRPLSAIRSALIDLQSRIGCRAVARRCCSLFAAS
jgi:hypothetical protein